MVNRTAILAVAQFLAVLRPLLPQSRVPQLALTEVWRISAVDQDLSFVTWLLVSRTGEVVIGQHQDHRVLFYDASGSPVSTVGREGSGPGEFQAVAKAGWIGPNVWIFDGQLQRATIISPRGLVATLPVPVTVSAPDGRPLPGMSIFGPSRLAPAGGTVLLFGSLGNTRDARPAWAKGPPGAAVAYAAVDSAFHVVRILKWVPGISCSRDIAMGGSAHASVSMPFCRVPYNTESQDGADILIVSPEGESTERQAYRLTVIDSDGVSVLDRRIEVPAERISSHAADSAREAMARRAPAPAVAAADRKVPVPDWFPGIRSVLLGQDRSIWLERWTTGPDRVWEIRDPTGDLKGLLKVPRRIRIRAATLDEVWATDRDPDDLDDVVHYRLTHP
jgi:hypothetical protein